MSVIVKILPLALAGIAMWIAAELLVNERVPWPGVVAYWILVAAYWMIRGVG